MNKEKLTELILNFFAIVGFAIQLIVDVPMALKFVLWVFSGVCFFILVVLMFVDNKIREIDYVDFDDIIVNHRGEDVSKYISNMTMAKFAANS